MYSYLVVGIYCCYCTVIASYADDDNPYACRSKLWQEFLAL